jgi:putative SOS response-associated peptidase YedK
MCGRYVSPDEAALTREYTIDRSNSHIGLSDALERAYEASYNVAPTDSVPVVRVIRDRGGEREAVMMRWGLVPFWTRGQAPKFSTINAMIEKLQSAAAWKGPWERGQRCIMPCAGFYEWQLQPDGKNRQPYYIKPVDDETFALAGVWDRSITPAGERILSCAVITMRANDLMAQIHNHTGGKSLGREQRRMPAIVQKEDIDTWLTGTIEQAKGVLKEYPSDMMVAWPVTSRVNTPRNNDPELVQPIELDPPQSIT